MVCVFGGMASGQLVVFQQMGFGLAVAVFIDATIVRTIVVPAAMELLGERNWYLPRWLEWLPDVSMRATCRRRAALPEPVVSGVESIPATPAAVPRRPAPTGSITSSAARRPP